MPRLTEQEQQEIIRYIEADKPLPEKYRFLLFEDKREVELVWNGKTNEVCNIVLPFQTIENVDEPRAEDNQHLDLFDTRGRQRKGWTNKLIWGDNKLTLSSLKNGPLREEIDAQSRMNVLQQYQDEWGWRRVMKDEWGWRKKHNLTECATGMVLGIVKLMIIGRF